MLANSPINPLAVSIKDGARILGFGRSKFIDLLASGAIVAVKSGKRTLVPMTSLETYLASLPRAKFKPGHTPRKLEVPAVRATPAPKRRRKRGGGRVRRGD